MNEENKCSCLKTVWLYILLILAVLISGSAGYLYNNAHTQAKDIAQCQSVGASWYNNGFNQVLCTKKKPQCKEYFKE